MAEIWFYHLERSGLDDVLPGLLKKTLDRGWRALVRAGSDERMRALDSHLWTYRDESFLPHGLAGAPHAEDQPVLLTTGSANQNGAAALFIVDGARFDELESGHDGFERCIILFDGNDEASLTQARGFWKTAKEQGATASYWQQDRSGRWDKKAELAADQ